MILLEIVTMYYFYLNWHKLMSDVLRTYLRNRISIDLDDIRGVIFPKHPLASEQFCICPDHVALSTCIRHVPSLS